MLIRPRQIFSHVRLQIAIPGINGQGPRPHTWMRCSAGFGDECQRWAEVNEPGTCIHIKSRPRGSAGGWGSGDSPNHKSGALQHCCFS